ncbi:SMP-30/gluconolactonase/LRE family protein [Dyadobacter sediminis]|uniref:SMP-30/gluconolactonase/LRE family protein n=1 Tax=Dyadobacter sediminis TaxID=1493691 RepID=A0A5R9KIG0_9BACT|nr:SMP-30/gluconolactonase/LRE family protein [Dyadobacter sediminis]TLU95985.1 SMP-30/gluconolactonase/LRE family protein [Dyadobacter sediminis]GGB78290.1 gluconolactonase [Dyadobacter sediminis]
MKSAISLICLTFTLVFSVSAQKSYPTMGKIIYEDPAFKKLLPKDSNVEVIASGFQWCEGPVWVKDSSFLLFSDVPENKVFKWDEKKGLSVFLEPSGYTGRGYYSDEPGSNGLIIDNKGRLVSCEHGDRRISAMPLNAGGKVTLADHFQGKRFNSPNDIVQHANGSFYFTDPPYGMNKKQDDPTREIPQFGVYRMDPDGNITQQISDLSRPNGIAFSPDGKTLYIAQSDPEKAIWMAYPVDEKGNAGKGKILYDATSLSKSGVAGLPDGFKVDKDGNLWSSGPGGLFVISPAGKLLGRIVMGELTSNCAWGNDGSTLYMTVDSYLCRIKTGTKGAGW